MKDEKIYGSMRRTVKFDSMQKTLADETVGACNFIAKMIFNRYKQYKMKCPNKCPYTKDDYLEYLEKSIYPTNQWLLKTSYYTRLSATMYMIKYIIDNDRVDEYSLYSAVSYPKYNNNIDWFEMNPSGFKLTKTGFYIPRFGDLKLTGNFSILKRLNKVRSIKFIRVEKNYWNVIISYLYSDLDMPTTNDLKSVMVFGVSPWVMIYTPSETIYYDSPLNDPPMKRLLKKIYKRKFTLSNDMTLTEVSKMKLKDAINTDLEVIRKYVTNQMNLIFESMNRLRPSQLIIEKPLLNKKRTTVDINYELINMLEFDRILDRCNNLHYKYGTKIFSVRYNDINGVSGYFSGMSYRERCLQMKNNAIDIYSQSFINSENE